VREAGAERGERIRAELDHLHRRGLVRRAAIAELAGDVTPPTERTERLVYSAGV